MQFTPSGPQSAFYLISQMQGIDVESIASASESLHGPEGRACAIAADVMRRASENAWIQENSDIVADGGHLMIAKFTAESLLKYARWDPVDLTFEDETLFDVIGGWPEEVILRIDTARLRRPLALTVMNTARDHLVSTALDVLARLPGAKRIGSSVVWAGVLPDREELLSWLDVTGPGLVADYEIIIPQTTRRASA